MYTKQNVKEPYPVIVELSGGRSQRSSSFRELCWLDSYSILPGERDYWKNVRIPLRSHSWERRVKELPF